MVTRLVGGLTPADGADPRTFPAIFNDAVDDIEAVQSGLGAVESTVTSLGGTVTTQGGIITANSTAIAELESTVSSQAGTIASQGSAIAAIEAWDLEDLNDVTITSVADGQVVAYSTAVSGWVNQNSAAGAGVDPGAVMSFARNSAPTGWLKANGANVSRTTYADLFTAIGTTFGAGDGSTTFGLPDMRGEFPRGWDDGRGVDSGRAFGSAQLDQMQRLEGTFGGGHLRFSGSTATGSFTIASRAGTSTDNNNNNGSTWTFNSANSPNARVSATNSGETRARNLALLFCIKF